MGGNPNIPGGGGSPIPGSGIPKQLELNNFLPLGGIGGGGIYPGTIPGSIIGIGTGIGGGSILSPFRVDDSFDNKCEFLAVKRLGGSFRAFVVYLFSIPNIPGLDSNGLLAASSLSAFDPCLSPILF